MAAPGQAMMESPVSINVEETVFVTFPGQPQEKFITGHIGLYDLCCMMMFPCCCAKVPLIGQKSLMEYKQQCGPCGCPWAVSLDGNLVGKARDPGCCDNGCMFLCCAPCTCSGHIKLMSMDDKTGQERFVFARELFTCWICCQALGFACKPVCFGCVSMNGCCKYCSGTEVQTITQPVFKGPWSRSLGTAPQQIGEFVMSQKFLPCGPCTALPFPMRYYFKATSPEGAALGKDDMTLLAMVLQLYRGMPVPCKLFSSASFVAPTGIPMADMGLGSTVKWASIQEVLQSS